MEQNRVRKEKICEPAKDLTKQDSHKSNERLRKVKKLIERNIREQGIKLEIHYL